mmetsp:Transcript_25253/g.71945  ORF Transcript_25253/g.71945 Transcript_25253/m.71945 type:complete len:217 (+) Transcript_25253:513-1163(+)
MQNTTPTRVHRMHVRSAREQHLDGLASSGLCRVVALRPSVREQQQWRLAVVVTNVRFATCIANGLHEHRVGVLASLVQRASPMLTLVVHVGTLLHHGNGLALPHFSVLWGRYAIHIDAWPPGNLRLGFLHSRRPLHLLKHPAGSIRLLLRLVIHRALIDDFRRRPQQVLQRLLLGLLDVGRTLRLRSPIVVAFLCLLLSALLRRPCRLLLHRVPIV